MKSKDIYFEFIDEFVDYIIEKVENDEELFITIVARFEEMRNIFKEVMLYGDVNFENIHLECPEISGYDSEFSLSLWMNDGVFEIICEPLKNAEGNYSNPCGDETYLLDNCSSKIIPLCEGSDLYFVNVDGEEDCNENEHCDCTDCCATRKEKYIDYSTNDKDGTHGFTASKSDDNGYYSFSYYTNLSLSNDDIHSMLREFGF